ncbi:MAG: nitric oxide reductase transcriptional regulator NorR [Myxococcales bacterium]|nr:nitric oxide reductase transcriptional regulator NorR [Myxococcales bacterium]
MHSGALRAVVRAAIELTTRHSREAVLDAILLELERLVPFDMASVLVLEGDVLRMVAGRGFRRDLDVLAQRFRRDENPRLARALKAHGTVRFLDPTEEDPFDGLSPMALEQVHSCMAAPMRVQGELLGVITADAHEAQRFEAAHEELMELFAALAAVAIHNADLVSELERARAQLSGEVETLAEEIRDAAGGIDIVGESSAARKLREEISAVGPTDTGVLILGETGTGKELVARALHATSPRRQRPLIRFDCSAVAPNLIESELYGHVKGAFTGAVGARVGKLEVAHGGTLFLDEVGELPLHLQPRLLRALQERELERVGDHRVRRIDVRIIAATNRDLEAEVRARRFRADLFHRLAVYPLRVPPLAERLEDLEPLVRHFVRKLAPRLRLGDVKVDDGFIRTLERTPWAGNVRELENTVERALVRARTLGAKAMLDEAAARGLGLGPVRVPAAPEAQAPLLPRGQTLKEATAAFQRKVLDAVLRECDGNLARAARRLGEDRSNLHRRLRRLGR